MKKLLVVGQGHLGRYLAAQLGADLSTRRMADVNGAALFGYDFVLCAAGKTDLAWCEEHPAEALQANVTDAVALARRVLAAPERRFIHLSSGCVWDGPFRPDGEPFEPTDPPTPACLYAQTKAACDALLLEREGRSDRIAILRPRQVYSPVPHPRNTLVKLRSYERLLDDPNSMTSADTIAATARHLQAVLGPPLWGRITCVYDLGVSSPYRVGRMLADAGLRSPPGLLEKSDLDAWHKPKRVNTVLYDAVFEREVTAPPLEKELRRVIEQFAQSEVRR